MTEKKIHFEQSLRALEDLVSKLESGDLELEQALTTFEEGVKVSQQCQKALQQAQARVEILTSTTNGEMKTELFSVPDDMADDT